MNRTRTNLAEFTAGSILRIKLHNFLTYSDIEICPGPKLNIVLGPNGCGKSSIVCAIALGLCGSPKVLGRADDLKAFVMHECEEAFIEIEVRDAVGIDGKTVIRRTFSSERNASEWYINSIKKKMEDAKDIVARLKIQINNLCTFLPQDKVGNFSMSNPCELLEKTQEAVCPELLEMQRKLMELQETGDKSERDIIARHDALEQRRKRNEDLRAAKELAEKREEHLAQVVLLEKKLAWCKYNSATEDVEEAKVYLAEARKLAEESHQDLDPMKQEVSRLERQLGAAKTKQEAVKQDLSSLKKKEQSQADKDDVFATREQDIQHALKNLEIQRKNRLDRLTQAQALLADMCQQREEEERTVNIEELKAKIKSFQPEMSQLNEEILEITDKMSELKQETKSVGLRKRTLEQQLAAKMSVKDQQLEKVKQFREGYDALEFYRWLDKHRPLFRGKVYGPLAAEVSVDNPNYSKCLEFHVKNSVWCSFVVENQHDYDLAINIAKNRTEHVKFTKKNGLSLQVITVNEGRARSLTRRYPPDLWKCLQEEHGIEHYMDEVFEAPVAVRQALVDHSGVHEALIGNERAETAITNGNLLSTLTRSRDNESANACIFTYPSQGARQKVPFQRYIVTKSRYNPTGTSTSIMTVPEPKVLGMGKDVTGIKRLEAEIEDQTQNLNSLNHQVAEWEEKKSIIEQRFRDLNQKKKEFVDRIQKLNQLNQRIKTANDKVNDIQIQLSSDLSQEKATKIKELRQTLSSHLELLRVNLELQDRLIDKEMAQTAAGITVSALLDAVKDAKNKYFEAQRAQKEVREQFEDAEARYKTARQLCKTLLAEAEKVAPSSDAELMSRLQDLSNDMDEVQELIETETEAAEAIAENSDVLQMFEENQRAIEEEEQALNALASEQKDNTSQFRTVEREWKEKIQNIVYKLNALFSQYMAEMGCEGQVVVPLPGEAGGPTLFRDVQIQIKVKFRKDDPFKILNGKVHSGGERSVSTIMYLMSMQDLMSSPFRVVDEINQGMDERNERKVFSRIVQNSCGENRPQYFLITPKLLQGLKAMEHPDVTVLIIFNGPYIMEDTTKWDIAKFCEHRRKRQKL